MEDCINTVESDQNVLKTKCIGYKRFFLNSINNYCNTWEKYLKKYIYSDNASNNGIKIALDEYNKDNPHFGVIEIHVKMWYDSDNKKFYNHIFGMVDNMAGDFFWDSEYILEILRARNVSEDEIPYFIKNHKELEKRYLENDPKLSKDLLEYFEKDKNCYVHKDYTK